MAPGPNLETISGFLIWVRAARSISTFESYTSGFSVFNAWSNSENLAINTSRPEDIARYALYLENRGLKSGTRDLYLTALRSLWWWLERQGRAPFHPTMIPRVEIVDRVSYPPIEPAQFEIMLSSLSHCDPSDIRNRAILLILYNTGIRVGEMLSIQVTDLDLVNMCARVKTYKRKNHHRDVYWNEQTNEALRTWIAARQEILLGGRIVNNDLFFGLSTNATGRDLNRHHVAHAIRQLRNACGIKTKISAHSFRHGFATRGMQRNINPRYLQEMMGHAKLNTTMIYMQPKKQEIENEYRRIYNEAERC